MKKPIFTGNAVALVTPMTATGAVDYALLERLVIWQIEGGIDALVLCGTTGEGATLTEPEWGKIVEIGVQHAKGKCPIIVGIGGNNTANAITYGKLGESLGADAALAVTPYYNKTTQRGLVKHYYALGDAINIPLILYNVPSRTAMDIDPDTYVELEKHPQIRGVKEASTHMGRFGESISKSNLPFYSGNDHLILPQMAMGAVGVISVLSNTLPQLISQLCTACSTGNLREARTLQYRLLPYIHSLFTTVNPMGIKYALEVMGFPVGNCRLPLDQLTSGEKAEIRCNLGKLIQIKEGDEHDLMY